jgi:AraC-like DNA-binding protein
LNLIMSGRIAYRLPDLDLELEAEAGQLMVLPAGHRHELARTSEEVTLWVIELNNFEPLPWLEKPAVLTPSVAFRKEMVAGARRLWLRPPLPECEEVQGKLAELLATFEDSPDAPRPAPLHPAVLRAKHICENHLSDELDAATLARESGLSSSRLAHLFTAQVGVSPLQYRNFSQVQHFIRNYSGDERSLLRSALAAGFGSYAQFHRVFWQVCGERPTSHFKWLKGSGQVDVHRTLLTASAP